MYDGVEDPDSHIWQFKCAAKTNAWNSPMACHLFQQLPAKKRVHWRLRQPAVLVQDEPLIDFTQRFNDEARKILDIRDDQKISAFIDNMIKGHLYNKLTQKTPKIWQELLDRSKEFTETSKKNIERTDNKTNHGYGRQPIRSYQTRRDARKVPNQPREE
ncbi:hypothetical protein Tco_1236130 [Tanacetum coccineum]